MSCVTNFLEHNLSAIQSCCFMEQQILFVLGLLLWCTSVLSLTVTWNGTTISGPVFIYQDELVQDFRTNVLATPVDGTVICRSESQSVAGWHFTNGLLVSLSSTTSHFRQRRTTSAPSVSRLTTNIPDEALTDAVANGLWTCRLNGASSGAIMVGIYARGGGRGVITSNQVSLSSSSLMSDPPTFTLFGDTNGGPPTTYTWTRNGQIITNDASYSISIQIRLGSSEAFRESHYRSTLTVTGRLPGVYQYSVTNRATSGMVTGQFTITIQGGPPPTDVTAEQTGLHSVSVTWTAPSDPPTGYRVETTGIPTVTVTGTSHTFSVNNRSGAYNIQVRSLYQNFTSEAAAVSITVRGNFSPVLSTPSPTATSATITWTQPQFSLPVVGYTVTVTRVTGSGQLLCPSFVEEDQSRTTSPSVTTTTFTGLQEFSSYTVRVTANFSPAFGLPTLMAIGSATFITLRSVLTGPPRDVTPSTTSRSVSVSWSAIECIERNGEITNYAVIFQEQGGAVIPGEVNVMDRTFTASGLTPRTNYIFRVAGVNSNGTGPYSDGIVITTTAEVPGVVSNITAQPKFTSIVLTWSAPQEPNGRIISYEVTYRVSDVILVTTNTTDLTFTIPSLTPGTNVTEISVRAYNTMGRGNPTVIPRLMSLTLPSIVMNTELFVTSATSVRVSWDRLDIPEITGYIVYYSQTEMVTTEQSVNVPISQNSVLIEDLMTDVEYQFEVLAVAELDGDVVMGERSTAASVTLRTSVTCTKSVKGDALLAKPLAIAVVVTFVLTLLLYTTVLLLVLCGVYRHQHKKTDEKGNTQNTQAQVVYEEVGGRADKLTEVTNKTYMYGPMSAGKPPPLPESDSFMSIKNEAYGPVSCSK